jgi:predicted RNA-binding protein with EMAP domain
MDIEKKIQTSYNEKLKSLEQRVSSSIKDLKLDINSLNLSEVKALTSSIIKVETKKLHSELDELLLKKEQLEIALEKKSSELQGVKYSIFNTLETLVKNNDEDILSKLHQAKLQSIDLFELLSDTVESAILTALEKSKDNEAAKMIEEIIKELTYETIKEGTLNTIRVRKILSTILHSAISIAEATPNTSEMILEATLKGMRSGLLHSIDRFKKRLAFMPLEAKHILIEDYDTIMEDLNQTDTLFLQVVQTQANESEESTRKILVDINKKMHHDLEELVHMSKETATIMKNKVSDFAKTALNKADIALKSETAKVAKRMGTQAWGVAKSALGSLIKK